MADETAQPMAAETDPVAAAAALFKAQREPEPVERPRDEGGRFASTREPEIEAVEAEPEGDVEAAEIEAETIDTDEAADEAQLEAVEMPASWSKDDAEHWSALPPETQAKIAEREGQREAAVNQKFQEIANAKKAHEAQLAEANTNRDRFAALIDDVTSWITPQKPDPRNYGLGTGDYQREAYDMAVLQYEQQLGVVQTLKQQREQISAQQMQEMETVEREAYEAIEEKARPLLLAAVPEIGDPQKAGAALNEIVSYAIGQGIPEHVFTDPEAQKRITSAELLLAWKAKEYDRLQDAKRKVEPTAKPKPKNLSVRPGVTTPRSAIQQTQARKVMERLEKEGSIEAGAALFKQLRQGNL